MIALSVLLSLALPAASAVQFGTNTAFGTYIEGPAVDSAGRVYAVNYRRNPGAGDVVNKNSIGSFAPDGSSHSLFATVEGSEFNGLRFLANGNALAADVPKHRIVEFSPSGQMLGVFCSFPSNIGTPNDLAVTADGQVVFVSGMDWGTATGELHACFRNSPAIRLAQSAISVSSNGIELSLDEKTVYITQARTNSGNADSKILKIGVQINRQAKTVTVTDIGTLISFTIDGSNNVECDGMRIDMSGDLWVTRNGGGRVDRISPEGRILQSVPIPNQYPTNLAFGGPDGKTLYIVGRCGFATYGTGDGCVERVRVPAVGREYLIVKGLLQGPPSERPTPPVSTPGPRTTTAAPATTTQAPATTTAAPATTTAAPATTTAAPATTTAAPGGDCSKGVQNTWGQCGGINYSGPTCCAGGNECKTFNQWYSQCIPRGQRDFDLKSSGPKHSGARVFLIASISSFCIVGAVAGLAVFIKHRNSRFIAESQSVYVNNAEAL